MTARDCKHGHLARSCQLCEFEETIKHQAEQIQVWKEIATERAAAIKYRDWMLEAAASFLHAHGWQWDSLVERYRAEHGDAGVPQFWLDRIDDPGSPSRSI